MGRPRVSIIDDSQSATEIKDQKSKIKKTNKIELAKSESDKAIGEVETSKTEARGDGEKGVPTRSRSERLASEDARRDIEPAGPRATEKTQKPGKEKSRGKKYQAVIQNLDKSKTYPVNEAVDLVKKMSYSKFNATLEAHINTVTAGIRGLVSLPFASGRKLKILVFGKSINAPSSVIQDDTIMIGNDETLEEINKGKVDFDLVISTPAWMPKLAKVARILGPRGLMPNPKNSTITEDVKKAVAGFQAGKTEYKTESKAPVIHIALGKVSQPNEELTANLKTLVQTVGKTRVKKITLSPTMGPGVKVDLASV